MIIATLVKHLTLASALSPWVIGPAVSLLWIIVLLSLKNRVLGLIRRRLGGRHWVWADAFFEALAPAVTVAVLASGLSLLEQILPFNAHADHIISVAITAAIILALFLFADRSARRVLARAALESPTLSGSQGLLQGGISGILIALSILIFLSTIGISITPVLASLGIGTLAVALALQDTLANLFAGFFIVADKPVAAGNFIRIEGGEQGYVSRVGWRCTHIRMLGDSEIVVPNSKLASSVITNFSLPREQLVATMDVGVHYDSDLQQVERVTLEVAHDVMTTVPGALGSFEPFMRFHTFGGSSINYTIWLGAENYFASLEVKHEFVKRLHARYGVEGITLPFPIRTLDFPPKAIADLGQLLELSSRHANGVNAPGHDGNTSE